MEELKAIYLKTKQKKSYQDGSEPKLDPKDKIAARQSKLLQDNAHKELELRLFREYAQSPHPYWFNLILIEQTPDLTVSKFSNYKIQNFSNSTYLSCLNNKDTIACLTAKAFEKWTKDLDEEHELTDELKAFAFILATRNHLFMLDYICGPYKLVGDEAILPYLKHKLTLADESKDKAIIISSLMFHEHFDFEEILLPLLLENKINIIEKYLEKSPSMQVKFVQYLDTMNSPDALISFYIQ